MSLGRKAATILGSSTSLHILSTMTADFLLTAVSRSARPRSRRGTMIAKVGSWTSVTKVVAPRRWTVSGTFSGLAIHLMSSGMKRSISLFTIKLQTFSIVPYAAFLTSALVSHIASETTGIRSGTRYASCVGADSTSASMHCKQVIFSGHF